MVESLISRLFFIPEFLDDFSIPLHRANFYKYAFRFLRSLYWIISAGYPSRKLKLIGVTGTDGKTTTVNLIYQILSDAGLKVSVISTIYGKVGTTAFDTGFHVTTPDGKDLQKYLKKALDEGSEYFVLEATSHGLDQYRLLGCYYDIGVLTNLTREHLDYHKTLKNYFLAKLKLLKNSKIRIVNLDDDSYTDVIKHIKNHLVTFGVKKKADFTPLNFPFKTEMPGEYNKYNILASVAVARQLGIPDSSIRKSILKFKSLAGRMEKVENKKGITIVVDFAHTPNALNQAITALRSETKGKVISIFGAASERDMGKRPIMGEVVKKLSDVTILTSEDPRFEDPMKIIDEIAGGKPGFIKEPDRFEAIKLGISLAKKGDVVAIFGKGHEKTMNFKGVEKPWSDKDAVLKILKGS